MIMLCMRKNKKGETMKKNNYNYLMNHVDRAYGLVDDSDDVELTDRGRQLRARALDSIGELYDYLEEEE